MGEDDRDAFIERRAGQVVQQADAGLVGGVDVVDGEEQAVARSGEAEQLRGGDEQPLVADSPDQVASAPRRTRSISSRYVSARPSRRVG